MSEKDKLSFHEGEEEEFHITDEDIDRELAAMETDHASQPSEDASEVVIDRIAGQSRFAALKQLKRKHWIIIVIIVIIVLFGLLKMVGGRQSQASFGQITPPASVALSDSSLNTKKPEADLTKVVFEPSSSSMPASTTAPLLLAPTLSAPVASAPVAVTTKSDLTAIASNETKLTQTLEAIQQQNQMLAQQLNTLSNRVVGLESSFTQSNQAVDGLSRSAGTLKKIEAPAAPLPQLASLPTGPQYTVEAVVPQRAWLQAGDGSTMTVMIGDEIPGLGAVVSIDPYSGNVTTASGTVIKYGS